MVASGPDRAEIDTARLLRLAGLTGAVTGAAVILVVGVAAGGAASAGIFVMAVVAATVLGAVAGLVCGALTVLVARVTGNRLVAGAVAGVTAAGGWWACTTLVDWTAADGREMVAAVIAVLSAVVAFQSLPARKGAARLGCVSGPDPTTVPRSRRHGAWRL